MDPDETDDTIPEKSPALVNKLERQRRRELNKKLENLYQDGRITEEEHELAVKTARNFFPPRSK